MGQKCKSILRIKGRKEEIHMGDIPDHITKGFQESRKSWKTWKSKETTFEVKVNLEWSAKARESFLAWEFVHTLIVFCSFIVGTYSTTCPWSVGILKNSGWKSLEKPRNVCEKEVRTPITVDRRTAVFDKATKLSLIMILY